MKYTTTLLIVCACLMGRAQLSSEALFHLRQLRGRGGADSAFAEHVWKSDLFTRGQRKFITDRDVLKPLCVSVCNRDSLVIHDRLVNGDSVEMKLYFATFDSAEHDYEYFAGSDSLISLIDSLPAYGAVDQLPTRRLDSIAITRGGYTLNIPPSAYRCFYEINVCDIGFFHQPVMVYPSRGGQYLYLYLYGGEGAGTYFAKLVFDRYIYLTQLVTEYGTLRRFDAFRSDFVGY